jgi:hypothetical protein
LSVRTGILKSSSRSDEYIASSPGSSRSGINPAREINCSSRHRSNATASRSRSTGQPGGEEATVCSIMGPK